MLDQKEECFEASPRKQRAQTEANGSENIQAPSKESFEPPEIKIQFGSEIIFTCFGSEERKEQFFSWLWKDGIFPQGSFSATNYGKSSSFAKSESEGGGKREHKTRKTDKLSSKKSDDKLYTQEQVVALKKKLQSDYKGLLSKSTENDITLGVPVLIRFRCKNCTSTSECPFLHLLEYNRQQNGKVLYKHHAINSSHLPECILDEQNISYNETVRIIDVNSHILEEVIYQDPTIKPKDILQIFSQKIGENEDFLYRGLETKNVRRSIKKYFDNSVAKVKNKLKIKQ